LRSGREAGDSIPGAMEAGPPSLARFAPRFMLPQLDVEGSWS